MFDFFTNDIGPDWEPSFLQPFVVVLSQSVLRFLKIGHPRILILLELLGPLQNRDDGHVIQENPLEYERVQEPEGFEGGSLLDSSLLADNDEFEEEGGPRLDGDFVFLAGVDGAGGDGRV